MKNLIGKDIKNKTLNIQNLETPISQEMAIVNNLERDEMDCYQVEMKEIQYSIKIDQTIDYYSTLYNTDKVILIPYMKLMTIINENNVKGENAYHIPIYTVFVNGQNPIYVQHIKKIDESLCVSQIHKGIVEELNRYNQKVQQNLIYSIIAIPIVVAIVVVLGLFVVHDFKDKCLICFTLLIGSFLTSTIKLSYLSFINFMLLFIPVLITFIVITLANVNEKRVYSGSYDNCLKYVENHQLKDAHIRQNTWIFRSFLQREKANAFVYRPDELNKGWQDEYCVYIKK